MAQFHLIDAVRLTTGSVLVISPAWLDWFARGWQIGLGASGGVIAVLTIYKLIVEIKLKRHELKKLRGKSDQL